MTTKTEVFSAKVSVGLKRRVNMVCEELGLRKGRVVEEALREKLEDLMDAHDLREAMKEATGFHSWESVKKAAR
jgi:predicted DNA-binding protein